MSQPAIEKFIERCRRRLLLGEVAEAALWGAAAAAGVMIAAMFLPAGWLAPLRWLVLTGAAGWCGWVFWRWWRRRDRLGLARELEQRLCGCNRLEWASALELPRPGTCAELAAIFQARIAEEMRSLPVGPLVRWRRLLAALTAFLIGSGSFIALALLYPSRLAALEGFYSLTPGGQAVNSPGWIGDIQLRLEYPAYTGYEPVEVEGSDGTIRALAGTRVAISARADRLLQGGSIFYNQQRLPLNISSGNRLQAELVVSEAGGWKFELFDRQGHRWSPARLYPVILEVDSPPEIELLRPEADGEIQDQQALALEYRAEDDFGLGEVRLVWRVEGRTGGEQRRTIWAGQAKRLVRKFTLDLAFWRLGEQERLQFFLEACDNDTVNGPKCSRSAARSFSVYSPEKKKLELLKLVQAFWEQLLLQLADSLEAAADKSPPQEKLRALNDGAGRLLDSLERIRLDVSRAGQELVSLRTALENLTGRLRRLRARLEQFLSRPAEGRVPVEHLKERVAILEKDVLYLESLLDLLRLEQLDRLSERIRAARDRLEQLLREYLQAPSLEARGRLEEQIAELKEAIRQLEERQREVLKGVQDQYLNPQALARLLEENDLSGSLDRLQQMLHQGRLQEALGELERLRQRLERLGQQLQDSRSRLAGGRWQELARQMAAALAELGQIAVEQQAVLDGTRQLQRNLLEGIQEKYGKKLAAALAGLKKRLGHLEENLKRLAARLGPLQPQDVLERARQNARLLRGALDQLDLQAARSAARDLAGDGTELEMRLGFYSSPQKNQDEKLAGRIARDSRRLQEELEAMLPQEAELASGRAGQLKGLSARQRQLLDRLRQLQQQAEKLNRQAPLFGPGALGRLAAGGGEMQGAVAELERRQPSRAAGHQQQALEQLRALEKELQQSCESGEKGGMPLPLGGLAGAEDSGYGPNGERPDTSEVEIPSPQDFRPPEELRRKFLEGMKDPVPENYRPQVRAYYQELVK
jgi:hypothetical protein